MKPSVENPPPSSGEVSASERFSSFARKRVADGGVIILIGADGHDPSVADYRATSPYEWGG